MLELSAMLNQFYIQHDAASIFPDVPLEPTTFDSLEVTTDAHQLFIDRSSKSTIYPLLEPTQNVSEPNASSKSTTSTFLDLQLSILSTWLSTTTNVLLIVLPSLPPTFLSNLPLTLFSNLQQLSLSCNRIQFNSRLDFTTMERTYGGGISSGKG